MKRIADYDISQSWVSSLAFQRLFDCAPYFITSTFSKRRASHNPIIVERPPDAIDILPQFIARQLVGFRGDDQVWLPVMLKPLVQLQILIRGFVTRINEMN